jgi:hypothetical protein
MQDISGTFTVLAQNDHIVGCLIHSLVTSSRFSTKDHIYSGGTGTQNWVRCNREDLRLVYVLLEKCGKCFIVAQIAWSTQTTPANYEDKNVITF